MIIIILLFLALILMVYSTLTWLNHRILFQPHKTLVSEPQYPYDDLFIGTDLEVWPRNQFRSDKKSYIHLWHFHNFDQSPTILFCHGSSGNISHRDYIVDLCHKFQINLVLFDYQGYGLSSGYPKQTQLCQDGLLAYDYLRTKVPGREILIWGESLGGPVAAFVAKQRECRRLVLLSTFSSLDDILTYAKKPWLYSVIVRLFIETLPTKQFVRDVRCPVLILHSIEDEVVPYQCSQTLYNNVKSPTKRLITISGKHSAPIITQMQLRDIFSFCGLYNGHCLKKKQEVEELLLKISSAATRHKIGC